ncbi:META domain-containing protein [Hymenobacter metallicola]|uniref:META domain-containing protein n=1 Tax=Hymenobacter metallicola TaxID=2563114 RepID=A0A4Z0QGF1_9BACT|nr:META domain-containing protein [Hymenobacter metallicola]TGE29100.1 META domain-containing protein [Hymenobacter metallicola]
MIRAFLVTLGTALLLASCRATPQQAGHGPAPESHPAVSDASLRNTRWVVRSLHNRAISTPAGGEIYLLLRQEDFRAEGYAGCNRFRGTFSQPAANGLQFGPLLTTRMACPDSAGTNTETTFLAALAATRTYRVQGDTLRLYADQAAQPLALLHAVYLR